MLNFAYVREILARDQRLIRLQAKGKAVFMGNHEGYCSVPFRPADFWESGQDYFMSVMTRLDLTDPSQKTARGLR